MRLLTDIWKYSVKSRLKLTCEKYVFRGDSFQEKIKLEIVLNFVLGKRKQRENSICFEDAQSFNYVVANFR